ncbi:MAG: HEAT repeat domain-containing protein [Pelolinea sp.]|nr:HEAT repeat domain-containing protein [Pelolinea sp.]
MGIFDKKPNIKKMLDLGDVEGLTNVLMAAKEKGDIKSQKGAIRALGSLRDSSCLPSLFNILDTMKPTMTDHFSMFGDIAWALGEIGDKRSRYYLEKLTRVGIDPVSGRPMQAMIIDSLPDVKSAIDYIQDQAAKALGKISK